MRIAIFGATGPTGQELVKQALQKGHAVTAFVRSPEKLSIKDDSLTIVKGDVLRYDDVEKAVKGQDAVLSALGVKPPSKARVVGPGVANIIKAMERHGVKRLIVESAFFMDEKSRKSPFVKLTTATFMKGLYEDKKEQNEQLRNSPVLWTEVQPTMLTNGPKSNYKINAKPGMFSKISRVNVADFMLKQINDKTYVGKAVIITE